MAGVTYHWYIPSGWIYRSGQGSTSLFVDVGNTSGYVAVAAVNSCGEGNLSRLFVTVGSGLRMALYPNPTNDYVEVAFTSTDSTDDMSQPLPEEYELKIYNKYTAIVKSAKLKQKKHRFDVSDLPPDIYYVNVLYQEEIYRKQLVISR